MYSSKYIPSHAHTRTQSSILSLPTIFKHKNSPNTQYLERSRGQSSARSPIPDTSAGNPRRLALVSWSPAFAWPPPGLHSIVSTALTELRTGGIKHVKSLCCTWLIKGANPVQEELSDGVHTFSLWSQLLKLGEHFCVHKENRYHASR